jgi:hypothetical protein
MLTVIATLKTYWKPIVIGLVAVGAVVGYFYIQGLQAENARLTEEASQDKAAISRLTADLVANQKALAQREADSAKLANETAQKKDTLEKLYKESEEACAWSAGVIPDEVYSQLCQ